MTAFHCAHNAVLRTGFSKLQILCHILAFISVTFIYIVVIKHRLFIIHFVEVFITIVLQHVYRVKQEV